VRKRTLVVLAVVPMLLMAFSASGCRQVKLVDASGRSGISNETTTVALDGAQELHTTVRMGAVSLKLHSAETSSAALNAKFTLVPVDWRPMVQYSVDATKGVLLVKEAEEDPKGINIGDVSPTWDLGLARGIPTDLTLELGVGDSTMKLSGVDVTKLRVTAGVGHTTIDLSGPRSHDITGRIESGMGNLRLIVPKGIGVRLRGGNTEFGELRAPGFTKSNGGLVNSAWDGTGPKIDLMLTHGMGDMTIDSAE
jgi:hypothetical protein